MNNVSTGCILLGGLFIYDVFWVSRRGSWVLGAEEQCYSTPVMWVIWQRCQYEVMLI